MSEQEFLRKILADPAEQTTRRLYADYLEERGDPRGEFLRCDSQFERISFAAWTRNMEYYCEQFPVANTIADRWNQAADARSRVEELRSVIDPQWCAFMDTFGCPFAPLVALFNNTDPEAAAADILPFGCVLGTRGGVLTFAEQFGESTQPSSALMEDLQLLMSLQLGDCSYGAASCPVHPFICELEIGDRALTGADVVKALRVREFRDRHIPDLDLTELPYAGYQPGDSADEIHNDFSAQYIFAKNYEDYDAEQVGPLTAEDGEHGRLQQYVEGRQLWYVLLHTRPESVGEFQSSRYAVLLAVGLSPSRERLLGVLTHQVCHNLCD